MKFSILFFYHRIFPDPGFRRATYYVGTVMLLAWISGIFPGIFLCQPIRFYWDKSLTGTCLNEYLFIVIEAGCTIFTDVAILTMPLLLVWRMRISKRQKVALTGIFLLGGFVCVASFVRIPTLHLLFTDDPLCERAVPSDAQQANP